MLKVAMVPWSTRHSSRGRRILATLNATTLTDIYKL